MKDNPDLEDALVGAYNAVSGTEKQAQSIPSPTAIKDSVADDSIKDESNAADTVQNTGSGEQQQLQRAQVEKRGHEYNPARVKEFLIRVAKAVKRHQIRMNARKKFHDHVEKLKSAPKKKEKTIDDDIAELKRHVANLIEVERNPHHPAHSKYVKEKIAILEHKLDELLELKKRREARFTEIEERINKKIYEDKQLIAEVEKKLLHMERDLLKKQIEHHEKKKGVPKELDELKHKIAATKRSLELLKQSKKVISHVP